MYKFPKEGTVEYKLQRPFNEDEIEWRPQSTGEKNGKPWVMCIPYVQARAIQCRLDEVLGFDGWETEYRNETGGVMCKLTSHKDGKHSSKEDGSPETDFESFKGAITGSFKRVASSGFGIGRYLYGLEAAFALECSFSNKSGRRFHRGKNGEKNIWWLPPKLPSWALPPDGSNPQRNSDSPKPNGSAQKGIMKPPGHCRGCGCDITEGVRSHSVRNYNKPLCMNCQGKEREGQFAGAIKTLEEVSHG